MPFAKQSSNLGAIKLGSNTGASTLTSNNTVAGTITNATAITTGGPVILNALSNASYTLPATLASDIGAQLTVINGDGANAAFIFPAGVGTTTDGTGATITQANTINGASANTGVTFAAKIVGSFICTGAGAWKAGKLTIA